MLIPFSCLFSVSDISSGLSSTFTYRGSHLGLYCMCTCTILFMRNMPMP